MIDRLPPRVARHRRRQCRVRLDVAGRVPEADPVAVLVRFHTPNFYAAVVAWYYVAPGVAVFIAGMAAMLARVTEASSYQALQQFVTDAPWDAEVVWRRLRAVLPERTGILILDETSFPKQGPHSVGVARQYCGALGKVANCQVAVTAALWTGRRAWPLGARLYLPTSWTDDPERRRTARIPTRQHFQEKWRVALTLWRQVRAAGLTLTAVVADAEYGDNTTVRQAFHRAKVPYAFGISPSLTVFRGIPTLRRDRAQRPPRNRQGGWPDQDAIRVRTLSDALPARTWRRVAWRNGTNPPWEADFAAVRVTPANDWRRRRLAPEVWLLCERGLRADRAPQALPGVAARYRVAARPRPTGASALGDRAALPAPQDRTGARPLRRPNVSGLAAPHGDLRHRLCLSPEGAHAPAGRSGAHVPSGPGHRAGSVHGTTLRQSSHLHEVAQRCAGQISPADLTKVVLVVCTGLRESLFVHAPPLAAPERLSGRARERGPGLRSRRSESR